MDKILAVPGLGDDSRGPPDPPPSRKYAGRRRRLLHHLHARDRAHRRTRAKTSCKRRSRIPPTAAGPCNVVIYRAGRTASCPIFQQHEIPFADRRRALRCAERNADPRVCAFTATIGGSSSLVRPSRRKASSIHCWIANSLAPPFRTRRPISCKAASVIRSMMRARLEMAGDLRAPSRAPRIVPPDRPN